jgi:bromodomain-containing factor 1
VIASQVPSIEKITEQNFDAVTANRVNGINGVNGFKLPASNDITNGHLDATVSTEGNLNSSSISDSKEALDPKDFQSSSTLPPLDTDPTIQPKVSDLRTTVLSNSDSNNDDKKDSKSPEELQTIAPTVNGTNKPEDSGVATSLSSGLTQPVGDKMNIDESPTTEKATENEMKVTIPEPSASDVQMPHHPPVSPKDHLMEDAPAEIPDEIADQNVQPSIEASADDIVSGSGDQHKDAENVGMRQQTKVSRPRDDEMSELEPATKRARADDSPVAAAQPSAENTLTKPVTTSVTMTDASTLASTATPVVKAPSVPASGVSAPSLNSSQDPKLLPLPAERPHNPDFNLPMTKAQQKHLIRGITNAKKSAHAPPFNQPVDPVALNIPNYFDVVKEPMDLKTIDSRLKTDAYKTIAEFLKDFDTMVGNAVKFNGPDHPVTQHGFHLRQAIDRNLSSLPTHEYTEPTPAEKKAKKASVPKPPRRRESRSSMGNAKSPTGTGQTFALGPAGIPLIRRDSTVVDGRPRREIHPPAPKDLPYSTSKPKRKKFQLELKFCEDILTEMKKPKWQPISWPFQLPVDPVALNIPTYHKIIKKPMDISTIEKKLQAGQYENAKEFEQDMRLMFSNCYKFNPAEHAVYRCGKEYEQLFNDKWAGKSKWLSDHAPSSGAQSLGSSPEPDEDEDDEDEMEDEDGGDADQIAELQKSIEAMSKQVAALQQKKKASPPMAPKKGKSSKPSKKETKKPVAKAKKPIKKKEEKTHHISYEEKISLSDRIGELDDSQMQVALNIIRSGMPGLRVSGLRITIQDGY